jgi:heme exporter protein D
MSTEANALDWWTFGVTAFGSVATFAAVVVAIVLGVHEVRKFRREVAEREEERQAREARLERAQAEQVAGWLRYTPRSEYAEQQSFHVYADIVNASPSPVYDLLVHVHGDAAGGFKVYGSAWSLPERPDTSIYPLSPTNLPTLSARTSSSVTRPVGGGSETTKAC